MQQCLAWMEFLSLRKRVSSALLRLRGTVSQEAVLAALERMKGGPSLGLDGVPVEACAPLLEIVLSPMTPAVQQALATGEVPNDWLVSLQRNIPKSLATEAMDEMRLIPLQNVVWNWLATTILVVVEDVLQVAISPWQKGFRKKRANVAPHHGGQRAVTCRTHR